ncbi:hypothetical protein H0H92_005428 [Tricholoma furcatifolium]|nr:hypothetical protein H0H92_005428 [Tricholoma furcatifolium]
MSENTAVPRPLFDSLARHEATVITRYAVLENFTDTVETVDIGHARFGWSKELFQARHRPVTFSEMNLKKLTVSGKNIFRVPFLLPLKVMGGTANLNDSPSWNLDYPGVFSGVQGFRIEGNNIVYWYNFVIHGKRYEGNRVVGSI